MCIDMPTYEMGYSILIQRYKMVTNENKQDSKVEKKMDDIFMGVLMELLFFIVWCSLETSNIKKSCVLQKSLLL